MNKFSELYFEDVQKNLPLAEELLVETAQK